MQFRLRTLLNLLLWGKSENAAPIPHRVHRVIENDLGPLLSELAELGYIPAKSEYSAGAFGNYFVDFQGKAGPLRIVLDRGYYSAEGMADEQVLGAAKGSNDKQEFCRAVTSWLRARSTPSNASA